MLRDILEVQAGDLFTYMVYLNNDNGLYTGPAYNVTINISISNFIKR